MKTAVLFALLALASPLTAQTTTPAPAASGQPGVTDAENQTGFWDCKVPGGNYTVALNRISSVGIHEFMVTGGRVTEVTIDTSGSVVARFYFMESAAVGSSLSATAILKERAQQVAETAADRTGTDKVWQKVQKDYPLATHAHTIEFRLQNKADLERIHASVKKAWTEGKGRNISVTE